MEIKEHIIKKFQEYIKQISDKLDNNKKDKILKDFDNFIFQLTKLKDFDKNKILSILSNYKNKINISILKHLNGNVDIDKLENQINITLINTEKIKVNNIEFENLYVLDKINMGKYTELLTYFFNNKLQENLKKYIENHLYVNNLKFNKNIDNFEKINYTLFLIMIEKGNYYIEQILDNLMSLKNLCLYFYNKDKDMRMKILFKYFDFLTDNLEEENYLLIIFNNLFEEEEFLCNFKILICKFINEILNFSNFKKLYNLFHNLDNVNYEILNLEKIVNSYKYFLVKFEDFKIDCLNDKIYFLVFIKFLIEIYNLNDINIIINDYKNNIIHELNIIDNSKISLIYYINSDKQDNILLSYNYKKENYFNENDTKSNDELGIEDFEENEDLKEHEIYKSNSESELSYNEYENNNKKNISKSNYYSNNTKNEFNFWFSWVENFNKNN